MEYIDGSGRWLACGEWREGERITFWHGKLKSTEAREEGGHYPEKKLLLFYRIKFCGHFVCLSGCLFISFFVLCICVFVLVVVFCLLFCLAVCFVAVVVVAAVDVFCLVGWLVGCLIFFPGETRMVSAKLKNNNNNNNNNKKVIRGKLSCLTFTGEILTEARFLTDSPSWWL